MQVNLAKFDRAITYVIAPPDDRSQAARPTERTIRRNTVLGAALEPQHFDWQVEDGADRSMGKARRIIDLYASA